MDTMTTRSPGDPQRRGHVLAAALQVFARYGFRKASMDEVARAADISRPGLYFLFATKEELFRATVEHELQQGIAAVTDALSAPHLSLRERLVAAFDRWLGRYIEPGASDVGMLVETSAAPLGGLLAEYAARFDVLVAEAVARHADAIRAERGTPEAVAAVLHAIATGLKHQVTDREEFNGRMDTAIHLILEDRPATG
ncbi:TetR/AcrR family transcriptional regulator [Nonomuraea rubra]|uniref:AcrR family transcriptional regulator n=1 Tax=Nonomuraea rubra TaxID=46180 RepID=A0A7X0NV16_9ACTN|nr:TetR/AcrR family transcriptional regulator [Nonomuraea rubra]MBB6550143.1 AcrR family transcriptional regulator [Nonomuraea rubra]